MKYYKVIHNKKIIDVLKDLKYVRYQLKNKILLLCDESNAQGILSSNGSTAYHIKTLYPFPVDSYQTVSIEEITETEYEHLKATYCMSFDEIVDMCTLQMIKKGVI